MLRTKKVELVEELKGVFSNHVLVLLFHYKGLNVVEMEELRSKIYDTQSGFKVVKNTLASIATKDTACESIQDVFVGPTAIVWSNDPVAVPKVLVEFAKTHEHLKLVGGVYAGKQLSVQDVQSLATMPSLNEIRAKLAALLQTPATNLAVLLQKPASMVVTVLNAFAKK